MTTSFQEIIAWQKAHAFVLSVYRETKGFPDFERFGLKKIDQVYKDLMYQRLLCLSITFPKIKFVFNGKQIRIAITVEDIGEE